MDALLCLKEFGRMCRSYLGNGRDCEGCPREAESTCEINSLNTEGIKKLICDVERWSKENPPKTRQQDFLEKYPNAKLLPEGFPIICCARLGYRDYCGKVFDGGRSLIERRNCLNCWNTPLEDE